jgi:hypothetical protein
MQADACADRHADTCANIDSYTVADQGNMQLPQLQCR